MIKTLLGVPDKWATVFYKWIYSGVIIILYELQIALETYVYKVGYSKGI